MTSRTAAMAVHLARWVDASNPATMADASSFTVKRMIQVRAVVTPRWKEDAERELSNGIANFDQQLAQLEQEGQRVITEIRSQSANPLDPRVQEQVASVQQQVMAKRAELEEQKRQVLDQQRQVREVELEAIVDQGQLESFVEIRVGDNLLEKLPAAVLVRDGVVEEIEGAA